MKVFGRLRVVFCVVSRSFSGFQGISENYTGLKKLQGVSEGFRGLQGASVEFGTRLQGSQVSRCSKAFQRVSRGFRDFNLKGFN